MGSASEGATATGRRRIQDYLDDGEELGVEGPPRAVAAARSLLPRFRWARVARLGRKGGCAGAGVKARQPQQKGVEEEDIVAAAEKAELHDSSGGSACAAAGGETRPTPADLGVGLGLVFLLAKTSDEFGKMAKVRAEMETLLAEFKGRVVDATTTGGGDEDVSRARNVESAASSCLTDGNEPRAADDRSEDRRRRQAAASSSGAGAGVEVEVSSRKRSTEDVLEEEFHAELERLHGRYGSDTPPVPPEDDRDEAELSDDGIEADCRQGFEEDDDQGQDDDEEDDDEGARYRGVSAFELERRLHELLHQRNQERIDELEAALRRAEKRLFEKEMEASLWKDTAKMALRQGSDDHHDDDELQ